MEIGLKLLLSLIMGGLIGLERDITGHEAGLRTQILVSLGSATFIMIGDSTSMTDGDMSRIIQGVATGLGFLGAGAILKEGITVKGLTTAASIWVTATLGLAVGLGKYEIAIGTFAFAIVTLVLFGILEKRLRIKSEVASLKIILERGEGYPRVLIKKLENMDLTIKRKEINKTRDSLCVFLAISLNKPVNKDRIIEMIHNRKGVIGVEWEDLESEPVIGS